jgi:two-component system response regulator AtoC
VLHRRLQRYYWPGNIRELENVIRRYAVLGSPECILAETGRRIAWTPAALPAPQEGEMSLKLRTRYQIRKAEAEVVLEVLRQYDWNRRKAAAALRISYRALLYKMRDAGIRDGRPDHAA